MFNLILTIFIFFVFVAPRSFLLLKMSLLAFCLICILAYCLNGKVKLNSPMFFPYYFIFTLLSLIWAAIGIINLNPMEGITDAIRLNFVFMWIYFILILYISNCKYYLYQDLILSTASLTISFFCIYTLIDFYFDLNWFAESIKEEMQLRIGVHEGYTQLVSHNIGMFCFLVPYLICRLIITDNKPNKLVIIATIFSLISVIISSRRIIFVLIMISPLISYIIFRVSGFKSIKTTKLLLFFYGACAVLALTSIFSLYLIEPEVFESFTSRFLEIFEVDELSVRQLQHAALMNGLNESPIFGSGFAGLTDLVRSEERPWTFELTYSRILFNSGFIGSLLLVSFYSSYFYLACNKISKSIYYKQYIALLTGMVGVLIASASNPYLGNFDYIFVLSIIPLILNTKEHRH